MNSQEVANQALKLIAPPPKLTISQWADTYRVLSRESSAEPGRWRTDRAPYQREMLDAICDDDVKEVVVMSSAQIGKTELINCVVGFFIHQDPAPMLVVQPTLDMGQAWSKDRLMPMIRDTPELDALIGNKSRESESTILQKVFPGGHITICGANSPASLASRPIRIVLCDEVDRYPESAGTEGDPVNLATKRATTFSNSKIVLTSTPTVKDSSRIELAFSKSDQRHFFVPCPHCGEFQTLKWKNVKWEDGDSATAAYFCEACGSEIPEREKPAMLRKGEWRATEPFSGCAGFHINELYSPWVRWSKMVKDFLEAKKSPETLKTFVNTALGETWDQRGKERTAARIVKLRDDRPFGLVPREALGITAAADTQKAGFWYEVRAWGPALESWQIRAGYVASFEALAKIFWEDAYRDALGGVRVVNAAAIDAMGDKTDQVYEFCRLNRGKILPLKGELRMTSPFNWTQIDTYPGTKKAIRGGLKLLRIDTTYYKNSLSARLEINPADPGAWRMASEMTDAWAEMMASEYWDTTKARWVCPNGKDNHAWDVSVYGLALADILGVKHWKMPEETPKRPQDAANTPKKSDEVNPFTQGRW